MRGPRPAATQSWTHLPKLDATMRTADRRDQCRLCANMHRQVETEGVQDFLHPFGVRVFSAKIDERCTRRRRARGMRRLSPVDEKRDDAVRKICERHSP